MNGAAWKRQRGAALVVGLVLMLILTILGVSGMNTATLELTMAANAQAGQLAFQAAESGIEMALAHPVTTNVADSRATHSFADGSVRVDTELRCVDITRVPAGEHSEDPNARALHFEVTAVGRGPRNAVSRLTQGFYVVVPATALPDLDADGPDPDGPAAGECLVDTACPGLGCIANHEAWLPARTYWRQDEIDD
ncbi:MAG TPA: pilus assembly PilX N-terminal domain-containing protein [Gammaproteobacteria bacterium]